MWLIGHGLGVKGYNLWVKTGVLGLMTYDLSLNT